MKPTSYLAALKENDRLVFLSDRGIWLPKSAFDTPGTTHRFRVFRYEESARGVAEDWARKAGCEAHVQEVR